MESDNPSTAPEAPVPCNVLFLCTGNYYRSRFAEEVFNHIAAKRSLPFRATSLGFTPHPHINPGSISAFTLKALAALEIQPLAANRMPAAVQAADFLNHPYCIALCDREHRPMVQQMFPEHLARVRFWHIEDLGFETPGTATARIVEQVQELLTELQRLASSKS